MCYSSKKLYFIGENKPFIERQILKQHIYQLYNNQTNLQMRSILFLLLVIFVGTCTMAQQQHSEVKVKTISLPMSQTVHQTNLGKDGFPTVTGIYVLKNSRIKRALEFKARKRRVKLA